MSLDGLQRQIVAAGIKLERLQSPLEDECTLSCTVRISNNNSHDSMLVSVALHSKHLKALRKLIRSQLLEDVAWLHQDVRAATAKATEAAVAHGELLLRQLEDVAPAIIQDTDRDTREIQLEE